jgi:hypothetical protein
MYTPLESLPSQWFLIKNGSRGKKIERLRGQEISEEKEKSSKATRQLRGSRGRVMMLTGRDERVKIISK